MLFRILFIFVLLHSIVPASDAQRRRTARQAVQTPLPLSDSVRKAVNAMMIYPSWIMGGNKVLYTTTAPDGMKTFFLADADAGRTVRLFDGREYATLTAPFTTSAPDPMDPGFSVLREQENAGGKLLCMAGSVKLLFDPATRQFSLPDSSHAERPVAYPGRPMWIRYTAGGDYGIYGQGHNLYLTTGTGQPVPLTRDGELYHSFTSNGRSRYPDDQPQPWLGQWYGDTRIGYTLRTDTRKVTTLTLVNSLAGPAPRAVEYKFELPGDRNVTRYELWLVYADSAKAVEADIGRFRDQEVKLVYGLQGGESPGGIWFTRKNRVGDTLELCRLDPRTGSVSALITEAGRPVVNDILHTCAPFNGGREILWWSERSGKGAYYLYDGRGNLVNPVTEAYGFVAGNVVHLDTRERYMILEGYGYGKDENPCYKKFFRVNLDGTGFTQLTPDQGEHSLTLSLDRRYLIDRYSTAERMPRCDIRDMAGNVRVSIPMPDESLLIRSGWNPPRLETVKAADHETDLFGIVFLPPGFDPARKYPVVCNVYPGPQTDNIPLGFSIDGGTNAALAREGFIVLQFGYRGSSPLRGRDFYTYGHWNLRDYALEDCKHVVEQLAVKYPCMDLGRVGIYGHSGGGFMSATAIMTYPDFFKVAVASSGNHDNNIYGKFWTETYHGITPVTADDGTPGFRSQAPTAMELAARLKGRLLLVTGDLDSNVHPAHTLRLADALIKAGRRFDMMVFPGAGHEMGGTYYERLILNYFNDHLMHPAKFNADIVPQPGNSQASSVRITP